MRLLSLLIVPLELNETGEQLLVQTVTRWRSPLSNSVLAAGTTAADAVAMFSCLVNQYRERPVNARSG